MTVEPTWQAWAEQLATHLDDAIDALDPDGLAPELHDHRATLDAFGRWRLEQQGQTRINLHDGNTISRGQTP